MFGWSTITRGNCGEGKAIHGPTEKWGSGELRL
jgi:hypothetical protein